MAGPKLTKGEIVEGVAARAGTTRTVAAQVLEALEAVVTEHVASGGRVVWTGFLSVEPRLQAAREATNPRNGDKVKVPARVVVRARPGAKLSAAAN